MNVTDEQLLMRAVAGEHDAFAELLKRHAGDVRRRMQLRIPRTWQSVLTVDDVMQVTYFEAFQDIGRRRPRSTTAFRNWLFKTAEHNLCDALRWLRAGKRPDPRKRVTTPFEQRSGVAMDELLAVTRSTPSRAAARKEAKLALGRALRRLPDAYRRVIALYDLQGRSVNEVAERMRRRPGAVFMLRARAFERLRGLLGGGPKLLTDRW